MNVFRWQAGGLRTVVYRPWEECDGAWHRKKHFGLYSIIGLGEWGQVLDRSKIPWCLSFFSFIFSSGSHLVQQSRTVSLSNFGRGSPKEHSCKIIEKSVQQCQRSLLKQKLQCMHVTFMENQPALFWRLKAWWTEGQMDEWINKQTEGNFDTLDWYITLYQIVTKSIILLEKYELFKYFNTRGPRGP